MTPPSQQQTSIPSPGSTCSSTSGHQQHSPPHRSNHSPARSLPSPVTPPMPLSCLAGWLLGGGGVVSWQGDGGVLLSSSVRLLPSVCASVSTPLRSRLLDRCQSPTLGLSTLHPHTHRGNYSLGACLPSPCSTIYHQSVHRHLSPSPLHPDITGPRGLRPTSAAIT
ncbi:hypothetical protein KUCAC02_017195 [Chaenocephalus aceratus]|uniref:Uncharacterized protein n=1 Tax=Chaenocephalus aceratus TaxID=36190 RepID=A0ACB9W1K9_CHAAC|nr:hypothetical protein KUCAC02_017195 [Chaenocephalus aceratus]